MIRKQIDKYISIFFLGKSFTVTNYKIDSIYGSFIAITLNDS